jgi:PAS domain S-box-containing protein
MRTGATLLVDTKGIVRHWNKDAEDLFGYSAADVVGQSMEFLVPNTYRERHWAGFNKAIESGAVQFDPLLANLPLKCLDGTVCHFPIRQTAVRDAFDVVTGVLTVFSPACKPGDDNGFPTVFEDAVIE